VKATLDLLIDGETGTWHLANPGIVTWAEFARMVTEKAGYDSRLVQACSAASLGFVASRPAFTALASERGDFMPSLEDSVDRFFSDRAWDERLDAVSARK
jgi:dTDP-4-dehydrorhamnose reductase